jgi:hypothetical protein
MSKKPKYTDEPMEIGERVEDFLPPPSQLVTRKTASPLVPNAETGRAIKAARNGDLVKAGGEEPAHKSERGKEKAGMKIGYARVSTTDQNPALQLAALKREGCDKIFTDKLSGAIRKRPELDKCLKRLNAGDVLVVRTLSSINVSVGFTGSILNHPSP